MITLKLPWPPTANTYFRSVVMGHSKRAANGAMVPPMARVLISEAGRIYRRKVCVIVMASGLVRKLGTIKDPVCVSIIAQPPDRRRRDLDNCLKGLLDSLTEAHVWEDDSLIDDLRIQRSDSAPGGRVVVMISVINNPLLISAPASEPEPTHPF